MTYEIAQGAATCTIRLARFAHVRAERAFVAPIAPRDALVTGPALWRAFG